MEHRAVRINGTLSEWLDNKVGMRQVCILSPCLFTTYLEAIMLLVYEGANDVGKGAASRMVASLRIRWQ